jgi:RNA 3'-terminal phosphate cyclase (ATP)
MIHIDGSQGEGGGQILRSALALSMALGRPFTITRIRANRPKPGLMRQHITAVEAAAAICSAKVQGAAAGSAQLVFEPGPVRAGVYRFAVGTAGSTTLVLQAILPALLFANEPSDLTIEGGTHARWAPPFDFFDRALAPLLTRLGAQVSASIDRHGFYPAGGGCIRVRIDPARPTALILDQRGDITARKPTILLSKLHRAIAERELARIRDRLGWESAPDSIVHADNALGPGNAISLELRCEHVTEVFCALGEQGKPSEAVADEAVDCAREYLAAGVPVGRYLADQLMVPLAIAAARGAGESAFRTMPLSRHAATNADVIEAFLPGASKIERTDTGARWSVRA